MGLDGRPRPVPLAHLLVEDDPIPPTGDLKGPPTPTSATLAPTEYPPPFRQVDAYEGRSIGGVRDQSAPTVWIPHKQPMPLSSFYHITVRDLGGIIANTEKMRYNAQ